MKKITTLAILFTILQVNAQTNDAKLKLLQQLETSSIEGLTAQTKGRKVSIEDVFKKVNNLKSATSSNAAYELLLDLCTLSNSDLEKLLSKFGDKTTENEVSDKKIRIYFQKAAEITSQNLFLASKNEQVSQKLNELNKSLFSNNLKRPEFVIFGIAEMNCAGFCCGFRGCNCCLCGPKCGASINEVESSMPKTQTKKSFGSFSIDLGYIASSNNNNSKEGNPLFAGNGFEGGVGYRYGGVLGGVIKTKYATGSINQNNLKAFAKTFEQNGVTARTTSGKNNWSQVNIAAGPSLLFAKYKGEISFIGGVSIGSANTLKIDLYDVNTFYKNAYTATERKIRGYWEVEAKYNLIQLKTLGLGLRAGYGANGGNVGIGAIVCLDPICRCRLFGDCKSSSKVIND